MAHQRIADRREDEWDEEDAIDRHFEPEILQQFEGESDTGEKLEVIQQDPPILRSESLMAYKAKWEEYLEVEYGRGGAYSESGKGSELTQKAPESVDIKCTSFALIPCTPLPLEFTDSKRKGFE